MNGLELRIEDGGNGKLTLEGYASRTETPYQAGSFEETIKRGAFRRSLGENPDTSLLVNHEGLPLARTTSGNLRLEEDSRGLRVQASLERGRRSRGRRASGVDGVVMERGGIAARD